MSYSCSCSGRWRTSVMMRGNPILVRRRTHVRYSCARFVVCIHKQLPQHSLITSSTVEDLSGRIDRQTHACSGAHDIPVTLTFLTSVIMHAVSSACRVLGRTCCSEPQLSFETVGGPETASDAEWQIRTNTSHGDRSFAVAGPSMWNSLPAAPRLSDCTLATFRTQLKTLLFVCRTAH